jgi:hypothetical protein
VSAVNVSGCREEPSSAFRLEEPCTWGEGDLGWPSVPVCPCIDVVVVVVVVVGKSLRAEIEETLDFASSFGSTLRGGGNPPEVWDSELSMVVSCFEPWYWSIGVPGGIHGWLTGFPALEEGDEVERPFDELGSAFTIPSPRQRALGLSTISRDGDRLRGGV